MCKLKSAIVLKDRIFMPDYDSHSQMLEELGIKDDYLGASKKFVRVELSPEDDDVFSDIDGWVMNVDQDITPEWFSAEECRPRMVEAVKKWAQSHIFIGEKNLEINGGANIYIKDCEVNYICGSATVNFISGSATVKRICDSATVDNVCGSATVNFISGSATVENICDSATVENICDSATVKCICGSATVKRICGSASVISGVYSEWENASKTIIKDNATYKDRYNKVIYQSGKYKLVSVKSGKKIGK